MADVDSLDLLAQELGFALKSEPREGLESLLRGNDVFAYCQQDLSTALFMRCLSMRRIQVPSKGQPSLSSRL